METEKLNILKLKYKDNFKTKSDNSSVLLLYSYILEKENVDSDWWNEDHGCNNVVGILERNFSDFDWEMLEKDLENWTLNQIELFTLSIINGSCGNGLFEDLKVRDLQKRYTYEKRLQILIKISKNQTLIIWDNIDFLKRFPYMPFESINKIAINIGYYNYLLEEWKDSHEMKVMKELIQNSTK